MTEPAGAASTATLGTRDIDVTKQQRRLALGLISTCHTLNHLQYSITAVLFPVMASTYIAGMLLLLLVRLNAACQRILRGGCRR